MNSYAEGARTGQGEIQPARRDTYPACSETPRPAQVSVPSAEIPSPILLLALLPQ
jgi:hypothetical protein